MWLQAALAHMVVVIFLMVALHLFNPMDYFTGGRGGTGLIMLAVALMIAMGTSIIDRRQAKKGRAPRGGARRKDNQDDAAY